MSRNDPFFVFAVIGTAHVEALGLPLRYLRHFSSKQIVVVQGRSNIRANADFVIEVAPPSHLSDHQASLWLKTGLLTHLRANGLANRQFCYLDSDVIALSHGIDDIFSYQNGPVGFCADQVEIDVFSHWAVNCGCRQMTCHHLREALLCDFEIDVYEADWTMWNGGVFVADDRSMDFLKTWHDYTNSIFEKDYWKNRDQGTLAAAVWRHGIQSQSFLPKRFNYVLDCLWGLHDNHRSFVEPKDLAAWPDFELKREIEDGKVTFLHLINRGIGRAGWRHWDAVLNVLPA
jgi:hypothetical protein